MAKKTSKKTTKAAASKATGVRSTTKKKAVTASKATKPKTGVKAVSASTTKKTTKRTTKKSAAKTTPVAAATPAAGANGHGQATIAAPKGLVVDDVHYGPLTEEELKKVKTGLTRKDLEYFRQMLMEKRAELLGDVEGLELARSGSGDVSHMPLHMADVGSDHYDQEFNLGLMESEKRLLREIDEALIRIQNGTYGVCLESGRPIPRERLEIKPWARYTIEVVMERERRGIR